jgi:arylsulfatase A-like enzyme
MKKQNKFKELLVDKPDIVIIITDQERATQYFPEGWEQENLPTLTKLKDNGFTFDKAFCNSCMCTPSRATLFTGTYPSQHQCTETLTTGGIYSPGEIQLNNKSNNIGKMLDSIGYDVQYRGKWHLSKGADGGDPLAKEISLYGFKGWVGPDAGEDAKPENFGGGYPNADARYVKEGIEYLEQVRISREKGEPRKPYCLVLSLVNPHDVLGYPKSVQFGYTPDEYTGRTITNLPPTVTEQLLKNGKPMAQLQTNIAADGLLGVLRNDDMKLNYLNFYAYLLTKIDGEIGKFIDVLYDGTKGSRLADDAVVIRLADHGEMGMSHGGMRQKAFVAYEEALRIPMVISNPIVFNKKESSDELATLIDIFPTISEIVGVPKDSNARGESLIPIIEEGKSVQDSILFTFDDTKSGSNNLPSSVKATNRLRAIRTHDWKYTYYFDSLGRYQKEYELYDLVNDTEELHNLAYKPKYREQREYLHQQLMELEERKLRVNEVFVNKNNQYEYKTWVETNPNFETYAYNDMEGYEKENFDINEEKNTEK